MFKIDNDAHGRVVWARLFSGELHMRDQVLVDGSSVQRVTRLEVVAPHGSEPRGAGPGDIARLRGLSGARIGDWLGQRGRNADSGWLPEANFEAVVEPIDPADRGRMFAALTTLTEQDPLIGLRVEDGGEVAVSLFGEVQKDVLSSLLADQFGITVRFQETTVRRIERVDGAAEAVADMKEGDSAYLATLGLRVAPAPAGSGLRVQLAVERGSMPPAFFTAAEAGIRAGLSQGRYGWPIPDAQVTITRTGYSARQSHAHRKFDKSMSSVGADFRNLAPMLVHRALAHGA
nr:TetM/TetW/TetO/TetS family tetracycline resistance ribosomal protection protein [Nigerium massiliense]